MVEDNAQIAIDERVIEDTDLEALLEQRQTAKEKAAKARKAYATVDEEAKGRLHALELDETPARIGRFVISQREVEGRSVAFETGPSTRLSIRLIKDAEAF